MKPWMTQLHNEARVLVRNPVPWAVLIGGIVFGLLFSRGAEYVLADEALYKLLRLNLTIPMFLLPLATGALAPQVLLRETKHGATEIFSSYPTTIRQWLSARVGALFILLLLASILAQAAILASYALAHPAELSAMAADSMLWTFAVQAPACAIWASAAAWLASRRPNAGLLYIVSGIGWLTYIGVATTTGTPLIVGSFIVSEPLRQAMMLVDPYAATALLAPASSNWLQLSSVQLLIAGRLFWLAAIILVLRSIRTTPGDSARYQSAKHRKSQKLPSAAKPGKKQPAFFWGSHVALHVRFVVRDKVFPLAVFGWIILMLSNALGGMDYAETFSRIDPTSRDALNRVAWDALMPAGALLLLYMSDRICRLYSTVQMHEFYAASPHHPVKLILAQLVTVWILTTGIILLTSVTIMGAQLIAGSAIQLSEYPSHLWPGFSKLIVFGSIFVACHGMFRSRLIANMVAFLVMSLNVLGVAAKLSIEHPLFIPVSSPISMPDHYWGFGGSLFGHHIFMIFWALVAITMIAVAMALHDRNLPFANTRWRDRIRRPATAAAGVALLVAIAPASYIHTTLASEGALSTADAQLQWRADYENKFSDWKGKPQPQVAEIISRVDFFPEKQRAHLAVEMRLVNRTDAAIERILVGRNQLSGAGRESVTITKAEEVLLDESVGQRVFALYRPLPPGGEVRLQYKLDVSQSGLAPSSMPLVLKPQFSALPAFGLLPTIGYDRQLELSDPINRRELGLPKLADAPPSALPAMERSRGQDMVLLTSLVSTSRGHSAVAQGRLLRQWDKGDRSFYSYRTDKPIRRLPAFFSVPWEAQSFDIGQTRANVFAPAPVPADDPNHLAIKDTIRWLSRNIAPYQGTALHVFATPEIGSSGFALPQIVQVSNRLAFRAEPTSDAGFNQAYRRAAHETAHQWFGHLLGHGIPEEHAFLIESLTKYIELVMVEQRYGKGAADALVEWEMERYQRALIDPGAEITPLVDAESVEDHYSRSSIVFSCLRSLVGDAAITRSARQIATATIEDGKAMRSVDFVDALRRNASEDDRAAISLLLLGTSPLEHALEEVGCKPAAGSRGQH